MSIETEDDAPGDAANGAASKAGSHVESASEAAHANKRASAVPQFRKRGFTIVQKVQPPLISLFYFILSTMQNSRTLLVDQS